MIYLIWSLEKWNKFIDWKWELGGKKEEKNLLLLETNTPLAQRFVTINPLSRCKLLKVHQFALKFFFSN